MYQETSINGGNPEGWVDFGISGDGKLNPIP